MGIYGTSISLNKSNCVQEESYDIFSENFVLMESVVFNEFCNHKNILESFSGSEIERTFIKEKCDLLLEISMKDIKNKIDELIDRFINFIKMVGSKIKEIFIKEKAKKTQEEIDKAKQTVSEYKKDNKIEEEKPDFTSFKEKIEQRQRDGKLKANPITQFTVSRYLSKDISSLSKSTLFDILSSLNIQKKDEYKNETLDNMSDVLDRLLDDNTDSSNNKSYSNKDNEKYQDDSHSIHMENMKKALDKLVVINPDFEKKIKKSGNKYTTDEISKAIREDLSHLMTDVIKIKYTYEPTETYVKNLEEINKRAIDEANQCLNLISKYEYLIRNFKSNLDKIINTNKDKNNMQIRIDHITKFTNYTINVMKDQIQFIMLLSKYCSEQSTFCFNMAKQLNMEFGN